MLIEIRKSVKSLEVIGQIMRNQYGVFKKDKLYELFLKGQNAGLRLLKSFIHIMNDTNLLDSLYRKDYYIYQRKGNKNCPKKK